MVIHVQYCYFRAFCGSNKPDGFTTPGHYGELTFRTSVFGLRYPGFWCTITSIDQIPTTTELTTTEVLTSTSPPISTLGCGQKYILKPGQKIYISSPGYPSHIPSMASCSWNLKVGYFNNISPSKI